jgi:Flp pilus assembly protein CpaB
MPAVKHIVSTAIILIVGAAAVYFFMNNATRPSATACADAHMNIAAFGDSLVAERHQDMIFRHY